MKRSTFGALTLAGCIVFLLLAAISNSNDQSKWHVTPNWEPRVETVVAADAYEVRHHRDGSKPNKRKTWYVRYTDFTTDTGLNGTQPGLLRKGNKVTVYYDKTAHMRGSWLAVRTHPPIDPSGQWTKRFLTIALATFVLTVIDILIDIFFFRKHT